MNLKPLSLKLLKQYSPKEFRDYIKSLYVKPESRTPSSIEGVTITWGKRKIFRIQRDPKHLTRKEIKQLVKDYHEFSVTEEDLISELTKRKIEVRK